MTLSPDLPPRWPRLIDPAVSTALEPGLSGTWVRNLGFVNRERLGKKEREACKKSVLVNPPLVKRKYIPRLSAQPASLYSRRAKSIII
jgi:hypothetical protein